MRRVVGGLKMGTGVRSALRVGDHHERITVRRNGSKFDSCAAMD